MLQWTRFVSIRLKNSLFISLFSIQFIHLNLEGRQLINYRLTRGNENIEFVRILQAQQQCVHETKDPVPKIAQFHIESFNCLYI